MLAPPASVREGTPHTWSRRSETGSSLASKKDSRLAPQKANEKKSYRNRRPGMRSEPAPWRHSQECTASIGSCPELRWRYRVHTADTTHKRGSMKAQYNKPGRTEVAPLEGA